MKASGPVNRVELECQVLCAALRQSWVRQDKVGAFTSIRELSHLFPDLLPPPEEKDGSNKANYYEVLGVRPQSGLNAIMVGYLRRVRNFLKERNPKDCKVEFNTILNAGFVLRKPRLRLSHDLVVARRWLYDSSDAGKPLETTELPLPRAQDIVQSFPPQPVQQQVPPQPVVEPAAVAAVPEPAALPPPEVQYAQEPVAAVEQPSPVAQESPPAEAVAPLAEPVYQAPPTVVSEPVTPPSFSQEHSEQPLYGAETFDRSTDSTPAPPTAVEASPQPAASPLPVAPPPQPATAMSGTDPRFVFDESKLRKPDVKVDVPPVIRLMEAAHLISNLEVQALKAQIQLAPNIAAEQLVLNAGYATKQEISSLQLAQELLARGRITIAQFSVAMYDERYSGLRMAESLQVRGWLETEVRNTLEG
ncbi:MAG: hypothetical protein K2W95_30790 [Candidatus Obscuribacterales bacterium]|nr:hypothetical protein [Candidatus Obscuribacterales bacterium]